MAGISSGHLIKKYFLYYCFPFFMGQRKEIRRAFLQKSDWLITAFGHFFSATITVIISSTNNFAGSGSAISIVKNGW